MKLAPRYFVLTNLLHDRPFALPLPCIVLFFLLLMLAQAQAQTLNGFDLKGASVPQSEIRHGGPPRDGIPALDNPRFQSAVNAKWLEPQDLVLGLKLNGVAKAYPLAILNWHELVNDEFGEQGVLISYCPLCGTGMAFESEVDSTRLEFGVSGLLYNSDVLFYDRQTQSLWSQIDRVAIAGPQQGARLQQLPLELVTWGQWLQRAPNTLVLSEGQGFARSYRDDPYAGYERSKRLFFKVAVRIPKTYHTKERVLGLVLGDQAIALPFVELRTQGCSEFELTHAGEVFRVHWDAATATAWLTSEGGEPAVHTIAFWFAWYAFHPTTGVFKAESSKPC